jgi:hypothetical protein
LEVRLLDLRLRGGLEAGLLHLSRGPHLRGRLRLSGRLYMRLGCRLEPRRLRWKLGRDTRLGLLRRRVENRTSDRLRAGHARRDGSSRLHERRRGGPWRQPGRRRDDRRGSHSGWPLETLRRQAGRTRSGRLRNAGGLA